MMKNNVLKAFVLSAVILSPCALAAGETTVTLGYAQSHVKVDGDKFGDNPRGANLKVRYEFTDNWGVLGSLTHTQRTSEFYEFADMKLKYTSLTAGPVYRFNEYVSAYGLVGYAHGKMKLSIDTPEYSERSNESENAFVGGVGMQFNVTPNFAIDTSCEYSKLDDFKLNTWVVGVGYRF